MKKLLAIALIFATIPGCIQVCKKPLIRNIRTNNHQTAVKTGIDTDAQVTQAPPINIWIHGTRLLPQSMFKTFFFSKNGLNHYAQIDAKYHQRKIAQTLIDGDCNLFPEQTFYLFGWSGKLSFKEREMAASKLYAQLKVIREEYVKTYGTQPFIRVLTHSHGGNIALLLEQVKDPADSSFFINELVLLAVPVQQQTMQYAQAPLFGKVYALYSILDLLQVADPQGLQKENAEQKMPLFSERIFPNCEKIDQVAIKLDDRSLMHIEFVKLKFLSHLPRVLSEIDHWRNSSKLCPHDWSARNKFICLNTKRK